MPAPCKRQPITATKQEIREKHRVKMASKPMIRKQIVEMFFSQPPMILANISKHHEHYGDTPAEHEARKNNS